jgi:hypothetical protein
MQVNNNPTLQQAIDALPPLHITTALPPLTNGVYANLPRAALMPESEPTISETPSQISRASLKLVRAGHRQLLNIWYSKFPQHLKPHAHLPITDAVNLMIRAHNAVVSVRHAPVDHQGFRLPAPPMRTAPTPWDGIPVPKAVVVAYNPGLLTWMSFDIYAIDEWQIYNIFHGATPTPIMVEMVSNSKPSGVIQELILADDILCAAGTCYSSALAREHLVGYLCLVEFVDAVGVLHYSNPHHQPQTPSDRPVFRYKLTPVSFVTIHQGTYMRDMRNATRYRNGTYIVLGCPMNSPTRQLIGGEPDAQHWPLQSIYEQIELGPQPSTLRRIKPTFPSHGLADCPPNNQPPTLRDTCASSGYSPTHGPNASIDLSVKLIQTDSKMRIVGEATHGYVVHPTDDSLLKGPVEWLSATSRSKTFAQLAPAFAGVTSPWLDRNTAAAITMASNWLGSTRTNELEPMTRNAIRVAAQQPIDLTILFVRLWSLYFSALMASVDGQIYRPTHRYRTNHVVFNQGSYSDWATPLALAVTGKIRPIYFDANAVTHSDDVLPVMALATSRGLRDALLADWLWPASPTIVLHVNQPAGLTASPQVEHDTVLAAIDMLVQLNDVPEQSKYARGLVAALAYRPRGTNLFGTPGLTGAKIRLPTLQTLGQFMQPLTLANTTIEPPLPPAAEYRSPPSILNDAAITSMNYLYHLHRALNINRVPVWWPQPYKKAYSRRVGSVTLVTAAGWYTASVALARDQAEGTRMFPPAMLNMWPSRASECKTLASQATIKGVDVLAWHDGPSLDDPSLAPLATVQLRTDAEHLPCGFDIPITTVTLESNLAHTLPTLWRAGCETILRVTNTATGEVVERKPIAEHAANTLNLPHDIIPWLKLQLMVNLPSWQAAVALRRNQLLDKDSNWYICTPVSYVHAPTDDDGPLPSHPQTPKISPSVTAPAAAQRDTDSGLPPAEPPAHATDDQLGDSDDTQGMVPALPPSSVLELQSMDPILKALTAHAQTLTKPPILPALEAIPDWVVPQQLLGDEKALQWLIESIPCTLSSSNPYAGTTAVNSLLHKTAEAIRLGQMRKMEARLTDVGDTEGREAIQHAIETLESALPLNSSATPATHASIPPEPQQTTLGIDVASSEAASPTTPEPPAPPLAAAHPPVFIPEGGAAVMSVTY